MADDSKTEQATPQRRQKAREKGQVARSRELPSAMAIFPVLFLLCWNGQTAILGWREFLSNVLVAAGRGEVNVATMAQLTVLMSLRWAAPVIVAVMVVALAGSIAQGGFVFATGALAFKGERISPAAKLGQIFSSSNGAALLKSVVPFTFIAFMGYQILTRDWPVISSAGWMNPTALFVFITDHCYEVCWRSALVLLMWSGIDYLLVRQKYERELRMSRQEIREEAKESEGNPQVKMQIRRMQRQIRRKQMLRDVKRATVVVTNPTHFAIALEYTPELAAPVVVAKGRNLLAQQIKQAAVWHGVPMVENPPLAHALYRTVEVGQAIPAKLYSAVAEILAFIYRTQQRVARERGGR